MPKLSPVSYKLLVRAFEADGFRCVREEGDHMVFTKPGVIRPVVIPKYASVPVFIIKNNLRTARMSRERYLQRDSLLFVPVGDSASRQVIRREFQRHTVAIHDLDPVAPESAGHRGQDRHTGVQLDRKHPSLELLNYFP